VNKKAWRLCSLDVLPRYGTAYRRVKSQQRHDISRHNAIDDGAHEHGVGEIEATGNVGCCHQQSQLPPIRPGNAEQAQHCLPRGFAFRRRLTCLFAETHSGVGSWIAEHVFLLKIFSRKHTKGVLKRNLQPKRRSGSQSMGEGQSWWGEGSPHPPSQRLEQRIRQAPPFWRTIARSRDAQNPRT
jgi:hypothetical protein